MVVFSFVLVSASLLYYPLPKQCRRPIVIPISRSLVFILWQHICLFLFDGAYCLLLVNTVSQCFQYSCLLFQGRTRRSFRVNLFRLAELHIACTREGVLADGINKAGKNIAVSLIFKLEDNLARFQSDVIELMSVVAGYKRPFIGVNAKPGPHDMVLQHEQTTHLVIADTLTLNRVFKHQYEHDCTKNDVDNSAECEGYSDVGSLKSTFGECVNITDPEVCFQMIEDPRSDYWNSMAPEAAHIKDKAKCTIKKDKTNPNNFIYMSRFLHCYFDGLNAKPPKFPSMKIRYVAHDEAAVPCTVIGTESALGLPPRHRVVVHIIFWDTEVRKYAMAFLRGGGRDIDALTYELYLYFQDPNKAAEFLNWKEEQTERAWISKRDGISASQYINPDGQEEEVDS
jgi:hypothetical protein